MPNYRKINLYLLKQLFLPQQMVHRLGIFTHIHTIGIIIVLNLHHPLVEEEHTETDVNESGQQEIMITIREIKTEEAQALELE